MKCHDMALIVTELCEGGEDGAGLDREFLVSGTGLRAIRQVNAMADGELAAFLSAWSSVGTQGDATDPALPIVDRPPGAGGDHTPAFDERLLRGVLCRLLVRSTAHQESHNPVIFQLEEVEEASTHLWITG